jgi:hypothetical protein
MGMTLIHAAQLESAYSCYNYKEEKFIEENLENMIESLTQRYSDEFI